MASRANTDEGVDGRSVGMRLQRILGVLALMLPCLLLPLQAQEGGRRHFAVLGPDQGLFSPSVMGITQDSDGFLWMGTENGLVRYEGGQSRRWAGPEGLPSSYLSAVLAIPGGGIWASTPQGLVRFRDSKVERTRFGTEYPSSLSCNIAMDAKGRLWAATPKGLYVQQEDLQFDLLAPEHGLYPPMAGARSVAMFMPWTGGLRAYLRDGSTRNWGPADGLPAGGPQIVAEDGDGRIWAGSGRTLTMKEPSEDRFKDQSERLGSSLSPNSAAYLDQDGSVWLPTQNGALHFTGERTERLDAAGGLPFRWVRTIFRDREHTLWLLGAGVARLQGGGRVWNYTLNRDLSGEVVWAIARDRDGTLLVGTDNGAARMGPRGLQSVPGTEGNRIKGLARDRQGTLWMVNSIGPALWLRPGQSRAVKAPLGEAGVAVNGVLVDSRGRVWLAHTRRGVLRWDPAQGAMVQEVGPEVAQAPFLGVYKCIEDGTGRIWAASTRGLLVRELDGRWQRFTEQDGLHPNSLHGLALLPDGSVWINYQEPFGLTRVRVAGGRLTLLEHRTVGLGLSSNLIFGVQVDGVGQTWVSTDQGLNRLEPPLHVGHHEGMASEDCAINALLAEEGRIWVGTAAGLVRFDTGALPRRTETPQARILHMTTGDHPLEPPFGTLAPVPSRDSTVTFSIAAPVYVNEPELRFQVRLRGLEEAWRDPGSHMVRYPALPGGHYRFEVRAAEGLGAWGPVAGLDFSVRPPWWKSWWANLLLALAGAGLGLALVRARIGALARSKAALEHLVTLRTLELSSRNEELSAALGNVKQLSGLLPICASCKKIRDDRGYWNQLETYITRHTDVDFSHGICPECVQELYPELANRVLTHPAEEAPEGHPHNCRNIGKEPK
jgi:ligand-binding sensor domain-containing protein